MSGAHNGGVAADDLVDAAQRAGVDDPHVLAAVRAVRRAAFVPPEHGRLADGDVPVAIPHEQVTTQPSLSARMVEALQLAGHEHVLEIGTGLGYQAALLARLADFVTTIDRWPDLAEQARRNLARERIRNVRVLDGDGTEGVPGYAPYHAIVVAAAFPEVPRPLVDQLRPGGRLVQPVGPGGAEQVVLYERITDGIAARATLCPASFVRLYGHHGYPE